MKSVQVAWLKSFLFFFTFVQMFGGDKDPAKTLGPKFQSHKKKKVVENNQRGGKGESSTSKELMGGPSSLCGGGQQVEKKNRTEKKSPASEKNLATGVTLLPGRTGGRTATIEKSNTLFLGHEVPKDRAEFTLERAAEKANGPGKKRQHHF